MLLAGLLLAGCQPAEPVSYQGYVEGEYVLLASPESGVLQELHVKRGDQVQSGMLLYALERNNELAAQQETAARLHAAEARFKNLSQGLRASELEALQAETDQAQAALQLATSQLQRDRDLAQKGYVTPGRLDEDQANLAQSQARLAQAQARLKLARESVGRSGELAQVLAEIDAAKAAIAQAEWRVQQKIRAAPAAGLIQDTFFAQGEWVPAGRPVVSLLSPEQVKLRFYVPETKLGTLRIGQPVQVACDGCGEPLAANIVFISPVAEFTPPVIYSRATRAKLVFLIEAIPAVDVAARLHPGQPVDVML
jgi:HlyD family secretion protein